jgi:hypothetical protein
MSGWTRLGVAVGLLPLLLLCSGCGSGDGRVRVRGKVTCQGEPVGERTLTLVSEGAPGEFFTQSIPLLADGTFSGEVAARGSYKVVIEESRAVQEGQQPVPANRKPIPAKYGTAATTDLSWNIDKSDNYKEFDLKE